MAYALSGNLIGTNNFSNMASSDATARHALGTIVNGVDNYYGGGSFIYMKAGAALALGDMVVWDGAYLATAMPNTANTGRSVAVAYYAMAINTFGWFQIEGIALIRATASVAAGVTFGITGAGTVGVNSAGKQILNATSAVASTGTVVKTGCSTLLNSPVITVPNTDGWYVGMTLSGTGIPAVTTISTIMPGGRSVTVNNNSTASGIGITVTGTHTNYIVAQIQRPLVQGAIT